MRFIFFFFFVMKTEQHLYMVYLFRDFFSSASIPLLGIDLGTYLLCFRIQKKRYSKTFS